MAKHSKRRRRRRGKYRKGSPSKTRKGRLDFITHLGSNVFDKAGHFVRRAVKPYTRRRRRRRKTRGRPRKKRGQRGGATEPIHFRTLTGKTFMLYADAELEVGPVPLGPDGLPVLTRNTPIAEFLERILHKMYAPRDPPPGTTIYDIDLIMETRTGEGGRPRYHHGVVPVDTPRLEIWFRPTPPGIAPRPGRAPGDHPQVPYDNADDFAQAIDEGEDAVLELGQPIVREMWADTLYDDLLPVAERPGTEMNLMYSSPQNPITVVVAR